MKTLVTNYKKELLMEVEGLPSEKIKEIIDFVCFIKAKEVIDPTQSYFWTKKWQDMEKEADMDKEKENVIGDGTVKDLLKKIKG
ncbi:MAG: hypothetical protein ACE5EA_10660 [Nitrospirota bacterium]